MTQIALYLILNKTNVLNVSKDINYNKIIYVNNSNKIFVISFFFLLIVLIVIKITFLEITNAIKTNKLFQFCNVNKNN